MGAYRVVARRGAPVGKLKETSRGERVKERGRRKEKEGEGK